MLTDTLLETILALLYANKNLSDQIAAMLAANQTNKFQQQVIDDFAATTATLQSILDDILFLQTTVNALVVQVTALGSPQQTGSPVTLPSTTPSGGSWVDTSNAGNTIWEYTETVGDITPYQELQRAGAWVDFLEVNGVGPQIDWLLYASSYSPAFDWAWTISYPSDDPSTILPTDDMLSWLTRENPGATVGWYGGTGAQVHLHMNTGDQIEDFLTLWIDGQFQELKAYLFGASTNTAAPIWPGIANVTLGAPIALSDGLGCCRPFVGCPARHYRGRSADQLLSVWDG